MSLYLLECCSWQNVMHNCSLLWVYHVYCSEDATSMCVTSPYAGNDTDTVVVFSVAIAWMILYRSNCLLVSYQLSLLKTKNICKTQAKSNTLHGSLSSRLSRALSKNIKTEPSRHAVTLFLSSCVITLAHDICSDLMWQFLCISKLYTFNFIGIIYAFQYWEHRKIIPSILIYLFLNLQYTRKEIVRHWCDTCVTYLNGLAGTAISSSGERMGHVNWGKSVNLGFTL